MIIILLIVGLVSNMIINDPLDVAYLPADYARVADIRFKKAMAYHGVIHSEYNKEKKEWGFYRDGEWCSLFRSIKRKKE